MATAAKAKGKRPAFVMNDELLRHLGVPASRVRLDPPPGTATARDVLRIRKEEGRRFELVDGTLVEKPMSADAGFVALILVQLISRLSPRAGDVGMLLGGDTFLRISSRFVRAPDMSFTHWDRLPNRKVPREPIPTLAPDLAVEVLSPTNTGPEMARKRREYFDAGVRLVWIIDPKKRTVAVYTAVDEADHLTAADTLTGGDVLPEFAVPIGDLFRYLEDEPAAQPKPKKKRKT